ncbi:hypothetical protein Nepgr_021445 [Nepenthes gracilis]|uniref:BZIP domain-containing protein n=1 Tax=Nepenthes gracilis TaxID=150966 RepID=A0AAD3XX13_NEPGR|nr:hypothetical protein Nepgr_021445 [Nepenthes gracilis]
MTASTTHDIGKLEQESDEEDIFTVPDMESQAAWPVDTSKGNEAVQNASGNGACPTTTTPKRRRGRNPADKEYRRLRRLLRNRVSAQQARERKKVYVNDLESKANDLQYKNLKLEEEISTLLNENTMLRKILMNVRPKADHEIADHKHDMGKS